MRKQFVQKMPMVRQRVGGLERLGKEWLLDEILSFAGGTGTFSGDFHHQTFLALSNFKGRLRVAPIRSWVNDGSVELGTIDDSSGTNPTPIAYASFKSGNNEAWFDHIQLIDGQYYYIGQADHNNRFDSKQYPKSNKYIEVRTSSNSRDTIGSDPYSRTYGISGYYFYV